MGYPKPGTQTITYTQSNLDLRQYTAAGTEIPPPAAFDPPMTTIDPGPDAGRSQRHDRAGPSAERANDHLQGRGGFGGRRRSGRALRDRRSRGSAAARFAGDQAGRFRSLQARPSRCQQPVTISTAARQRLAGSRLHLVRRDARVAERRRARLRLRDSERLGRNARGLVDLGDQELDCARNNRWRSRPDDRRGRGGTRHPISPNRDCEPDERLRCAEHVDRLRAWRANQRSDADLRFLRHRRREWIRVLARRGRLHVVRFQLHHRAAGDGTHSFAVRATDAVGNADASPATQVVHGRHGPPGHPDHVGSGGDDRDGRSHLRLQRRDELRMRRGREGVRPCTSPTNLRVGEGAHTFAVRAIDAAGNVDPTPASRSFVVDLRVRGAKLIVRDRPGSGRARAQGSGQVG